MSNTRRHRLTRKTQRRSRHRGGGEEEEFYAWVKTQKSLPRYVYVCIVSNALQNGVKKFGLDPPVADKLLQAYKDRDTDLETQTYLEEVLVKFGELDRDSAKRIVVG